MSGYRHIYHAGNVGDVLKHAVLSVLIDALKRKETALCYLDTHAGAGRYDLESEPARRHKEYGQGIGRLWRIRDLPIAIRRYLAAVRAINGAASFGGRKPLRFYPGSPWIVGSLLRSHDRMILTEINRHDVGSLKDEFAADRRAAVHHMDGYHGLKAFLPPRQRRGLILLDPCFENPQEFHRLVEQLQIATRRWAPGVYALWYPMVSRYALPAFYRDIQNTGIRKILRVELSIYPSDNPLGLNGSGMLIINPPWRVDLELGGLLPWLWKTLSVDGLGAHRVEWLVPE